MPKHSKSGHDHSRKFFTTELNLQNVTQTMLKNGNLTCRATNNPELRPVRATVQLVKFVPPLVVSFPVPSLPLLGGRKYIFTCSAGRLQPPPHLRWTIAGRPITENVNQNYTSDRSLSELTFEANPGDDGAVLACTASSHTLPGLTASKNVSLTVTYVPTATLRVRGSRDGEKTGSRFHTGDTATLECLAEANPPSYTVALLKNGRAVTRAGGVATEDNRIILQNLTASDAGLYTCVASNSVGDGQSNAVPLHVDYVPQCQSSVAQEVVALPGETVELQCNVVASPSHSVTYDWWTTESAQAGAVTRQKIHHQDSGLSSTGWFTISNHSYSFLSARIRDALKNKRQPQQQKDAISSPDTYPGEYLDLRPPGYKATYKHQQLGPALNEMLDSSTGKSKRDGWKTLLKNMRRQHDAASRGSPLFHLTDIDGIDLDDELMWTELARKVLSRENRMADFIGHKIEMLFPSHTGSSNDTLNHKRHPRGTTSEQLFHSEIVSKRNLDTRSLNLSSDGLQNTNELNTSGTILRIVPSMIPVRKTHSIEKRTSFSRLPRENATLLKPLNEMYRSDMNRNFRVGPNGARRIFRNKIQRSKIAELPREKSLEEKPGTQKTVLQDFQFSPINDGSPSRNGGSRSKTSFAYEGLAAEEKFSGLHENHRVRRGNDEAAEQHRVECWASNPVGASSQPCVFIISKVVPPSRVTNCAARAVTSFSAVVECVPGSSGGLPLKFIIEVRESENNDLKYQATWHEPVFNLENLKPEMNYTIQIRAIHEKGKSKPSTIVLVTKPRPPQQDIAPETVRANLEQGSVPNSPSLSSGTGNSSAVSAVVGLIVGCVVLAAVLVAVAVRCRSMLAGSKGRPGNGNADVRGSNDLRLHECEISEDCASGPGRDQDERQKAEHVASRESLLTCRDATDLAKYSPVLQNPQDQSHVASRPSSRSQRRHSSKVSLSEKQDSPDLLPRKSNRSGSELSVNVLQLQRESQQLSPHHLSFPLPCLPQTSAGSTQSFQEVVPSLPATATQPYLSECSQLNSATLQNIRPNLAPHKGSYLPQKSGFLKDDNNFASSSSDNKFIQDSPLCYKDVSHSTKGVGQTQMLGNSGSQYTVACDPSAQIVLNRGSQIVPVLLHDRTMTSPVPSTCSSLESSSAAHLSSSPVPTSNQQTLSTFQYPSPSHENNSRNFLVKRNRTAPPESVGRDYSTSGSEKQDNDPTLSCGGKPPTTKPYESLAINLEDLPPPQLPSERGQSVRVNQVLDHREENNDSDREISTTATIRRFNKKGN